MNISNVQYPKFNALRSAFYHTERKCFFDTVNRLLHFLIVVLGASIMAKVADDRHIEGLWLEFGIVVCVTLQMVFDFCGQANLHANLQKRCYELLAEIEGQPQADEGQISRWSAVLIGLCAEEPTQMRALDAICFNRALEALIVDAAQRRRYQLRVSYLHRMLRNIIPFHYADFRQGEMEKSSSREVILKPIN